MIDLSKKKLKCGSNVFDFLASRLPSKDLIFFDVGARNGSFILPENFSKYTTLYGFEPNIDEFKKLLNSKTDASPINSNLFKIEPFDKARLTILIRKEIKYKRLKII